MSEYPNTLFETAEQRAARELYEAQRKAFFESIPKRAEQTLIVGLPDERFVEELRKQLSELGVLRTLDQQRIAALEAELAQARADIVAAAGALLVPIPAPGTDMSKVMLANSQMRRERDEARAECERLLEVLMQMIELAEYWFTRENRQGYSEQQYNAWHSLGFGSTAMRNARSAIDAARSGEK